MKNPALIDLASVLTKLTPLPNGDYVGFCPWHEERNPSFHVNASRAHCFSCGWHGDYNDLRLRMGALQMHAAGGSDSVPPPPQKREYERCETDCPLSAIKFFGRYIIRRGGHLKMVHCYTNPEGKVLWWKARFEDHEGRKYIRPFYLEYPGCYVASEPAIKPKPLYRLHELLASHGPVWLVEGEKAADAIVKAGGTATTSGGANSTGYADWSVLAGRTIIMWPDKDEPGERYMAACKAKLLPLGAECHTIAVEDTCLQHGEDAYDYLKLGKSLNDLPIR